MMWFINVVEDAVRRVRIVGRRGFKRASSRRARRRYQTGRCMAEIPRFLVFSGKSTTYFHLCKHLRGFLFAIYKYCWEAFEEIRIRRLKLPEHGGERLRCPILRITHLCCETAGTATAGLLQGFCSKSAAADADRQRPVWGIYRLAPLAK